MDASSWILDSVEGKKQHDKRDVAADKDWQRERERIMKHDTRRQSD